MGFGRLVSSFTVAYLQCLVILLIDCVQGRKMERLQSRFTRCLQ